MTFKKNSSEEINLHDGFLAVKQELQFVKTHFYFLNLKTQHIKGIEDILERSNLHENMVLLERALLKSNTCTLLECETKIFAIREANLIKVHQELLDLIPEKMQLITCQAVSSTHISNWHNQLASTSGPDTLILKHELIKISQLNNKSYVNENLRFLDSEEKLLDNFHMFDQKNFNV